MNPLVKIFKKLNFYLILKFKLAFYFLIQVGFIFYFHQAHSWGARGHSVICEAAIQGVENEELKKFLLSQTLTLAYLCNIPDIHWRSGSAAEIGGSTHYIEPDLVGDTLENAPIIYSEFENKYKNKTNLNKNKPIFSVSKELGTSWWRAEQFFKLAAKQDSVNQMLIYMGVLGHFVGDNSNPLHNTSNYDGWANQHGGLHSFYENQVVINMPPDLLLQVIKAMGSTKKTITKDLGIDNTNKIDKKQGLKDLAVVENMKKLSIISYKDLSELFKIDGKYILNPSVLKNEKGMELKTPAKRRDPSLVKNGFEPLIIKHMARSAVLLSYFWDQIYLKANSPDLNSNKFNRYEFPHTPDFVPPDYIEKAN